MTQIETLPSQQLLQNRVALITGSSRGIGAATAKLFASHGAVVGVNYFKNQAAAQQVVTEIETQGGKAIAVQADVREQQQVAKMVQQVTDTFGAIDTLVLNADIDFPITSFLEYEWQDFEAKLTGELKGVFYACKAVVPSMVERQQGCIIVLSSIASRNPLAGFCSHCTAKSALDGFVKCLALELGEYNIRVNAVAPGVILTDAIAAVPQDWKDEMAKKTPLRRNGHPEDVAGTILLLAAETARFVTGAYLTVNGGSFMP